MRSWDLRMDAPGYKELEGTSGGSLSFAKAYFVTSPASQLPLELDSTWLTSEILPSRIRGGPRSFTLLFGGRMVILKGRGLDHALPGVVSSLVGIRCRLGRWDSSFIKS